MLLGEQACLLLCLGFQRWFYLQPKFKVYKKQLLQTLRIKVVYCSLSHFQKKKDLFLNAK